MSVTFKGREGKHKVKKERNMNKGKKEAEENWHNTMRKIRIRVWHAEDATKCTWEKKGIKVRGEKTR